MTGGRWAVRREAWGVGREPRPSTDPLTRRRGRGLARREGRLLETVAAAFLAGLVGSPHCVGMCGGFAAAAGQSSSRRAGERPALLLPVLNARGGVLLWHLGRLTTYAVLGALAGAFGSVIPGPRWVPAALSAALLLWFAASLAGLTPGRTIPFPALARAGAWLARQDGLVWRYLFGLATGVLPCGLVYAALSMAVASAAPATGAAAMAAFGLGTVPALAVLAEAVQGLARRGIWVRRALALLVLVAGLGSLGMRMARGGHMQHHMTAPAPTSTDGIQAPAHGGGAMPDMPGR